MAAAPPRRLAAGLRVRGPHPGRPHRGRARAGATRPRRGHAPVPEPRLQGPLARAGAAVVEAACLAEIDARPCHRGWLGAAPASRTAAGLRPPPGLGASPAVAGLGAAPAVAAGAERPAGQGPRAVLLAGESRERRGGDGERRGRERDSCGGGWGRARPRVLGVGCRTRGRPGGPGGPRGGGGGWAAEPAGPRGKGEGGGLLGLPKSRPKREGGLLSIFHFLYLLFFPIFFTMLN
jgi:translation initiation factor IF-2